MTFEEFKQLDYPDSLPMEIVLEQAFYKKQINFLVTVIAYEHSLNVEMHRKDSLFNEAATVITMGLSGNWKGKHKQTLIKRAIHIFNLNKTFPSGIYDKEYGYTNADKKEFDEQMKLHYGIDCDETNETRPDAPAQREAG